MSDRKAALVKMLEARGLGLALEPDPELVLPDVEEVLRAGTPQAQEALVKYLAQRHQVIARRRPKSPGNPEGDPLRYIYRPEMSRRVDRVIEEIRAEDPKGAIEILIMGAWQSGKTTYCAHRLMTTLVEQRGAKAVFLQETEDASKERQQKAIWVFFPNEFKDVTKGKLGRKLDTKVSYKQGDGFSNNQFVLPITGNTGEGSEAKAWFYHMDIEAMQGEQYDLAWCDELAPASVVETLTGRLFRKDGLLLVSFTPLQGYTPTVARWLKGVEWKDGIPQGYPAGQDADGNTIYEGVTEWAEADPRLLPVKDAQGNVTGGVRVPLVLRCRNRMQAVVWFHNKDNPWGNYEGLLKKLEGKPREDILIQAYGLPTKRFGSVFRLYGWNIGQASLKAHILANKKDFTFYMVMDPAGTGAARNPFMQWWAVNAKGQKVCIREWPQPGDYIPGVGDDKGVWAEDGDKADGKKGPGQEWFGFGYEGLSAEIARVEKEMGIEVFERQMDCRAGNTDTLTKAGAITLIEEFADLDAPWALTFEMARGTQKTETGETWKLALQAKLERSPVYAQPEIIICDCCQNTLYALTNWTGADGDKGACKDPVDATKYLMLADPQHYPPVTERTAPGGGRKYFRPVRRRRE